MKPIFNKNGLLYFREESNNNYTIMLKAHPELQQLQINRITYEILQNSNGENSIDNIVDILLKKYRKVDRATILQDLLDNLHMLYRMKLIYWENDLSPFSQMYSFVFEDYNFEIIEAEEVEDIFLNQQYNFYINARLKPTIVFGKTSLEQNIFSFNHTYIRVRKDKEFIACIGIGMIENNSNCFEILRLASVSSCDASTLTYLMSPKLIKQYTNRIKKFTTIAQNKNIVKCVINSDDDIFEKVLSNSWIDSSVDIDFISKHKINKTLYIRV